MNREQAQAQILAALMARAESGMVAGYSIPEIGRAAGVARWDVSPALLALERHGKLTRVRGNGHTGGNAYQLRCIE